MAEKTWRAGIGFRPTTVSREKPKLVIARAAALY
jgi:hypothetical protein